MRLRNFIIVTAAFLVLAAGLAYGGTAGPFNTSGSFRGGDTFTLTASGTNTATYIGADAATPADTTFDTTGGGAIIVGSADVTTLNLTNTGEITIGASGTDGVTFDTDGVDAALAGTGTLTVTSSSGDATIVGADAAGAANLVLDATTTGSITIGSADVTAVTITTDDTGDGTDLVLPANSVNSSEILTIVESIYWSANDVSVDGAQCSDVAQESTIAGPELFVIVCADNDGGLIGGQVVMPDSWDAGTVTFEYTSIQTGAETLVVDGDMEVQCRGEGETIVDTWSSEVAMLDAAQVGSSGTDTIQTASAITPDGTCAAGDLLIWQYSVDATGTTATVTTNNFIGFKMEYTSNVGD